MIRLIVTLLCVIVAGCSTPTFENECCTDGTCLSVMWMTKAECLSRLADSLERELEITRLKMQYECKETK